MADADFITELKKIDVLCGRGSGPNERVGNSNYRDLVMRRKVEYHNLPSRDYKRKQRIAQEIIEVIHSQGGRFVKLAPNIEQIEGQEKYVLVDSTTVLEKTKQALRQRSVADPKGIRPPQSKNPKIKHGEHDTLAPFQRQHAPPGGYTPQPNPAMPGMPGMHYPDQYWQQMALAQAQAHLRAVPMEQLRAMHSQMQYRQGTERGGQMANLQPSHGQTMHNSQSYQQSGGNSAAVQFGPGMVASQHSGTAGNGEYSQSSQRGGKASVAAQLSWPSQKSTSQQTGIVRNRHMVPLTHQGGMANVAPQFVVSSGKGTSQQLGMARDGGASALQLNRRQQPNDDSQRDMKQYLRIAQEREKMYEQQHKLKRHGSDATLEANNCLGFNSVGTMNQKQTNVPSSICEEYESMELSEEGPAGLQERHDTSTLEDAIMLTEIADSMKKTRKQEPQVPKDRAFLVNNPHLPAADEWTRRAAQELLQKEQNQSWSPHNGWSTIASGSKSAADKLLFQIQNQASAPVTAMDVASYPSDYRVAHNLANDPTEKEIRAAASSILQKGQSCDMSYAGTLGTFGSSRMAHSLASDPTETAATLGTFGTNNTFGTLGSINIGSINSIHSFSTNGSALSEDRMKMLEEIFAQPIPQSELEVLKASFDQRLAAQKPDLSSQKQPQEISILGKRSLEH